MMTIIESHEAQSIDGVSCRHQYRPFRSSEKNMEFCTGESQDLVIVTCDAFKVFLTEASYVSQDAEVVNCHVQAVCFDVDSTLYVPLPLHLQ